MNASLSAWLPYLLPGFLAILALATVWGAVLTRQKSMKQDCDETKKELKEDYLKEKDHELLCENNTLRFEAHVTQEIDDLKIWMRENTGMLKGP